MEEVGEETEMVMVDVRGGDGLLSFEEKTEEEEAAVDRFFQRTSATATDAEKRAAMIERLRLDLYKAQRQTSVFDLEEAAKSESMNDATLGTAPASPVQRMQTSDSRPTTPGRSATVRGGGGDTSPQKLGTFKGVFIPCLQNILGVILFLRLTWITAQAGTYLTTGIVLACATSTVLTALSLSAVATNGRVAKGGPYFIISRNLGPEVGTAVGLMFYLGTTVAASLYVLGAVESLYDGFSGFFDAYKWDMRNSTSALALMLVLACIVTVGVKQVNAAAEVFLAVVLFSVASSLVGVCLFAAGVHTGDLTDADRSSFSFASGPRYKKDPDTGRVPDLQVLLSIFYPSVTGIMAGSNRSGVLATPSQSIPVGTLSAIAVTTVLYVVVVWLFGQAVERRVLYEEQLVVALVAWPSVPLVKAGIVCSTIGAALQSLTGAPRLLYAIAADGTLPFLTNLLLPKSSALKISGGKPLNGQASSSSTGAGAEIRGDANGVGSVASHNVGLGSPQRFARERERSLSADDDPNPQRMSNKSPGSRSRLVHRVSASSRNLLARGGLIRLSASSKKDASSLDVEAGPQKTTTTQDPPNGDLTKASSSSSSKKKKKKKARRQSKESDVTPLAVAVTWFIASLPCLAGNLTRITPIVTMLFLVMYATVNLACFFLAYLQSPGFRPTWKYFHWSSALLGFGWCVALMFAISWYLAVVALAVAASIALYVRKEGVTKDWGDSVAGLRFQIARDQLVALSERSTFYHAKNWRPQLLVLCKLDYKCNPVRPELLEIAASLKKGRGLLMAHALIDAETYGAAPRALVADAATEVLRLHLIDHHIQGFPRAVVYRHTGSKAGTHLAGGGDKLLADPPFELQPAVGRVPAGSRAAAVSSAADGSSSNAATSVAFTVGQRQPARSSSHADGKRRKALIVDDRRAFMDAALSAAQSCGVGALRPNTVLLGWPKARAAPAWASLESSSGFMNLQSPSSDRARRADFVQLFRDLTAMRKALIVVKGGANLMPSVFSQQAHADPHWHMTEGQRYIDIWWVVQDGGLLLLLPWLMTRSKSFHNCRLRLFAVMTGLFAHYWNAKDGGAAAISECTDIDTESRLLARFEAFVTKLLADLRIDAEVRGVAGLDFVWAAAHVYRDTLGLRKRTTYEQQLTTRKGRDAFFKSTSDASDPDSSRRSRPPAGSEASDVPDRSSARSPTAADGGGTHLMSKLVTPAKEQLTLPPTFSFDNQDDSVAVPDPHVALPPLRGFALALNRKMQEYSSDACLVVTNLPYMTHLPAAVFVDYVDLLLDGLDSVMLVRGSGSEVVTKYG